MEEYVSGPLFYADEEAEKYINGALHFQTYDGSYAPYSTSRLSSMVLGYRKKLAEAEQRARSAEIERDHAVKGLHSAAKIVTLYLAGSELLADSMAAHPAAPYEEE